MILNLTPAKYIRNFSDMHQDFHVNVKKFSPEQLWNPEPLPEDKETLLILSGDLWHAKKPFYFSNYSWFKELSNRFQYIFVILGNHDFWGGSFPTEYANFERYLKEQEIENIYLLQDRIILMGDYKFIGATLWTDYNKKDVQTLSYSEEISSDLKYIRYNDPRFKGTFKKIKPKQFLEAHIKSINFIFENAKKDYPEQKLWVITHHPPTKALVNDPDLDHLTMGVVASDYDEEIKNSDIDYWIHGHNHQSGTAKIGNTTILANTVGYLSAQDYNEKLNPNYNPWFQLTLD